MAQPGTPGPYGFTFVNDVISRSHPTACRWSRARLARGPTDYNGFYGPTNGRRAVVEAGRHRRHRCRRYRQVELLRFGSDGLCISLVESIRTYLQPGDRVDGGLRDPPPAMSPVRGRSSPTSRSSGTRHGHRAGASVTDTRPGSRPGTTSSLGVDPERRGPRVRGLEEVYETTQPGGRWTTVGPYWNFGLPCGDEDPDDCPKTTHPDQHGVAFGGRQVWVGNDGGIYSREPRRAPTKWDNHNADLRHAAVLLRRRRDGDGRLTPSGAACRTTAGRSCSREPTTWCRRSAVTAATSS